MKPLRTREVLGPRTEPVSLSEDDKVQVSRGTEHPEKPARRSGCYLGEAVMFVLSVLKT